MQETAWVSFASLRNYTFCTRCSGGCDVLLVTGLRVCTQELCSTVRCSTSKHSCRHPSSRSNSYLTYREHAGWILWGEFSLLTNMGCRSISYGLQLLRIF
ncbi:hypothetical protein NPIL_191491 [Nephila pilipes]|uniref:Uncharacterized protein n=1 Tax=Nephila pilipes TaxID=299642 RepID=A0A8X6QVL0_NEPPI|nr:hypothetical protein NPIL_191491 [Nephila pilipes]